MLIYCALLLCYADVYVDAGERDVDYDATAIRASDVPLLILRYCVATRYVAIDMLLRLPFDVAALR